VISSRTLKWLILSTAVAVALYSCVAVFADIDSILVASAAIGYWPLFQILTLSIINYLVRFLRWDAYLQRYNHRIATATSLKYYLAGFALTTTPAKAGEVLRCVLLKRHGVPVDVSLGALFTERLIDILSITILSIGVTLAFPTFQTYAIVAVFAVVVAVPAIRRNMLGRFLDRVSQSAPHRRVRQLTARASELLATSANLLSPALFAQSLFLGLVAWAAEGLGFYILLDSLNQDVGLWMAIGIYSTSILVGALTFLPGGLGGTEAAMLILLALLGVDLPIAVTTTVVCRIATLWFAVVIGAAALALAIPQKSGEQLNN